MEVFVVNEPTVVYELFEDEVVIINFDNGNYFSLRKSGIDIWKMILNGDSAKEIGENLEKMYQCDRSIVTQEVSDLIGLLEEANLIKRITRSSWQEIINSKEIQIDFEKNSIDGEKKQVFEKPLFEKFTEMEDLLLVDPIHEVDESGWPYANGEKYDGNNQ